MPLRFSVPLTLGLAFTVMAAAPGDEGSATSDDGSGFWTRVVSASSLMKEARARWADAARARSVAGEAATPLDVQYDPGTLGRSGQLRLRIALPGESLAMPLSWRGRPPPEAWYRWAPILGTRVPLTAPEAVLPVAGYGSAPPAQLPPDAASPRLPPGAAPLTGSELRAPGQPGVYALEVGVDGGRRVLDEVRLLVRVPRELTRNGRLNGYHIGAYPPDHRPKYNPPSGFIEVTRFNRDLPISRHFRLGDFLTKDQHDVWPKYLALDTLLVDKLELVMQELAVMGVQADRMHVMSGFRTPQYNRGIRQSRLSRHQFGDAADVWVDNEANGWMSDLNGDGRVDIRDARVILRAVERVERRHPELIGGAGVYPARPGVRGPFVHIDVRGQRSRW